MFTYNALSTLTYVYYLCLSLVFVKVKDRDLHSEDEPL